MRETWTFHSASEIVFGRNAVKHLGEVTERLRAEGGRSVSDAMLEKVGLLERVRGPLVEAGLAVEAFTGGEPEPSMKAAENCIEVAHRFKPDVLVGLGGGSNMD